MTNASLLRLRRVPIDTHSENVAYLRRDCPTHKVEGLRALAKIEVQGGRRHLLATLNLIETNGHGPASDSLLRPDELGLSVQAFDLLGLADGAPVHIEPAPPPRSLVSVREKINGQILGPEAYRRIVEDISDHRYSRMELAAFLVASAGFMTTEEVLALTRAMVEVGTRLTWDEPLVVDKHCIGGIPGNRTTMLTVPIVAAHGLAMPKTSSRAITSPAGTADTMEVLCNVNVDLARMREIIAVERGCLVWGGHMKMAPADDIMISVERPLGIDTQEQMVASILSKKVAAGSTHLLMDIPMGPQAKVKSQVEAVRLRKLFEYVGDSLGLHMDIVITDGHAPVGRGIGPVLEARDVMQVLRGDPRAPRDLKEKSIMLAGRVLEFDPAVRGGRGATLAREILDSGRALAKMEAIMAAQGAAPEIVCEGDLTREVCAAADGTVVNVDCAQINHIARLAGCPMDKGAGIDLFVRPGDRVRKGDPLYRIHACRPADFGFATAAAEESDGVVVG
jgi:thymidine phosphorylase